MSPSPKKARREENQLVPESDEEEMYAESAHEDESDEEQPEWARRQEQRMLEFLSKMLTSNLKDIKDDIVHIKQQVSSATKTAEQSMKNTQELSAKVSFLEQHSVTLDVLNQKIEVAFQKLKVEIEQLSTRKVLFPPGANLSHDEEEAERLTRTVVIGGFMQDSERDEVKSAIEKHIISETDENVDEIWAYAFGSIGFVRFKTASHLKVFLKTFGMKPKPQVGGKSLWATITKSPEERNKAKHLGKYKRVLIEVGLAKAEDVRVSYGRGILMVKRARVAVWRGEGDEGHVEINEKNLKSVGIDVTGTALKNAVDELLMQMNRGE